MNKHKTLYFVLAILVGAFLFIYGGIDDSPGAQLIGLILVVADIVFMIKGKKKKL